MTDREIGRTALIVTSLASFMTPFMGSSVTIAMPLMGRELGMDAVMLGWVNSAYLLAAAVFLVPFGRFADRIGRKRIFMAGLIVHTLTSLALAVAQTSGILIALRVIQGIGATMMFGTGMAILTSVYPPQERGKALGIITASVYLGLSLGPFIGGLLTDAWGWRSLFAVAAGFGVAVLILTSVKLKGEWAAQETKSYDFPGALIYIAAVGMLLYGFSSLTHAWSWGIIAAGAVLGFLFLRREMAGTSSLLAAAQFRGNTAFVFSNAAAFINYSATFAVSFLLSLYLQFVRGFTAQHAGTIMVAQPIVMAVFSPLAGRLSDRIQPRVVSSIGMGLAAIGLFLLAFLNSETPMIFIIIGLMILGLGFALFSSPNSNAVMSSVDKRHYGVASAVLGTMRLAGQMLSMAGATLILAWHVGNQPLASELSPDIVRSSQISFVLFAILCTIGIGFSLARGHIKREQLT